MEARNNEASEKRQKCRRNGSNNPRNVKKSRRNLKSQNGCYLKAYPITGPYANMVKQKLVTWYKWNVMPYELKKNWIEKHFAQNAGALTKPRKIRFQLRDVTQH